MSLHNLNSKAGFQHWITLKWMYFKHLMAR